MPRNWGIQKNGERNILERAGTADFKRSQTAAPPGGSRFSGRSAFGTATISRHRALWPQFLATGHRQRLAALADALETITGANSALEQYAQSRRADLATMQAHRFAARAVQLNELDNCPGLLGNHFAPAKHPPTARRQSFLPQKPVRKLPRGGTSPSESKIRLRRWMLRRRAFTSAFARARFRQKPFHAKVIGCWKR